MKFRTAAFFACLWTFIIMAISFAGMQKQDDDFNQRYWRQIVGDSKILATDSMVQLFIEAPDCMPMETSGGFPRYTLGARRKFVDERGQGWLIECTTNWDAKAKVKKNGSEEVHIYPQDFKSSLIFESRGKAKK